MQTIESEVSEGTSLGSYVIPRTCRAHHHCERQYGAGDPCLVCDMSEARATAIESGRLLPFLVVAYGVDRCYGGPEEGGWYYDRTEVLAVRVAYTVLGGARAGRELREEHPTCPRGRGSVLGGTDVYIRCVYSENDPRMPRASGYPGRWE